MVADVNLNPTILRIICNYIRYSFGKHAILPEYAVHNLVTGFMDAEYVTYEYDKEKGMINYCINFWYR